MPDPQYSEIKIDTIANGALCEYFDLEFAKILANIEDPNTDAEAVRELTLKVKIYPDKDRTAADYLIESSAKLAKASAVKDRIYIGRAEKTRKLTAYQNNMKQTRLFEGEEAGLKEVAK